MINKKLLLILVIGIIIFFIGLFLVTVYLGISNVGLELNESSENIVYAFCLFIVNMVLIWIPMYLILYYKSLFPKDDEHEF